MNSIRAKRNNPALANMDTSESQNMQEIKLKMAIANGVSIAKIFASELNPERPGAANDNSNLDDKDKKKKLRLDYKELNPDQRHEYFRIMSAKQDKKRAEKFKKEQEILDWKIQEHSQKLKTVQNRKKLKDMEDDVQR